MAEIPATHRWRTDVRFGQSVVVYEYADSAWPAESARANELLEFVHPAQPEWSDVHAGRRGVELIVGGLRGLTVTDWVARVGSSPRGVAAVLASLLGYLSEIHARGWVHGRLDADLVWVEEDRVQVVGLGLEWTADAAAPDDDLAAVAELGWQMLFPRVGANDRAQAAREADAPDSVFALLDALSFGAVNARQAMRLLAGVREELAVPTEAQTGVPASLSAEGLVGRTSELEELGRLVEAYHLVTILGPGGMGKTRLSRALLSLRRGVFVAMAEATSFEHAVGALAVALGVDPSGHDDPLKWVAEVANARRVLVVLDNAEQIGVEVAELVRRCLAVAPALRFVVTSRVVLDLPGERVFELGPLDPSSADLLFVQSAQRLQADFSPAPSEVRALVLRVDRIPLAIQLAAAQAPGRGMAALAEALAASARLDSETSPTSASMRSTLEWSWLQLSEAERDGLLHLATFRGGFTFEQATRILAPRPSTQVVALLGHLRDASWLHERAPVHGLPRRFGLYAPLLDDLVLRLGQDEALRHTLEAKHATVVVEQAEALLAGLTRHGGSFRRRLLLGELANIEAAAERCESRLPLLCARASLLLCPVFLAFGTREQQLKSTGQAMERTRPFPALHLRARVDRLALFRAIPLDEALAMLPGVLSEARSSTDRVSLARALLAEARFHVLRRDERGAVAALVEAGEIAAEVGDLAVRVDAVLLRVPGLGQDLELEGRVLEAVRESGYDLGEAALLYRAGWGMADTHRQIELWQRALELCDGTFPLVLWILHHLAIACWEVGDTDSAVRVGNEFTAALDERAMPVMWETHLFRWLMAVSDGRLEEAQLHRDRAVESAVHLLPAERAVVDLADAFLEAMLGHIQRSRARFVDAHASWPLESRPAIGAFRDALLKAAAAGKPGAFLDAVRESKAAVPALQPAHRWLLRAVERWAEGQVMALQGSAAVTLWHGPELRWVRVGEGPVLDLARKAAGRRVLAALLDARVSHPGQGLTRDALVEAGWPGERMTYEAANNRLYVLLARLRREGLRNVIITRDDGYLIDPDILIDRAGTAAPPR